jgi:hypothetical protein
MQCNYLKYNYLIFRTPQKSIYISTSESSLVSNSLCVISSLPLGQYKKALLPDKRKPIIHTS